MLYSLFLLVIKTSTESFWSRKEKQRLFDGRLSVACLSCGKLGLIPSKHRDIQHIHSVQHILDDVHNILHTEELDQLQPWPLAQPHAFHNILDVHRYKDIHNVRHIQYGVHNILHKEEQGQPLLLVQPQLHACHNSDHIYKDIHIHILDGVHNILHKEELDQPQPWGQPLHRQQLPDRQLQYT